MSVASIAERPPPMANVSASKPRARAGCR
jgi:hypothetical protein